MMKNGESIWGGYFADELSPTLKHSTRGIVSMANRGPNTNGSQFFIIYSKQSHLNGKYTIFGKVIAGWETLDLMERVPVKDTTPLDPIEIRSVTIHANPIAEES
eukprot:c9720_g1_i2.p1 GENE.c9720_g1_i2~~c9720_g1_i2.p1  ORF type:complete len:104 (+),score=23.47 c9720_g1_i2:12-323(+)